jgi:catechol 2,3-dioxygenase-like lactoylglutathione lyase family enzyme
MKKTMTFGLTHLAIGVKDLDRTLSFYRKVFDVDVMYHQPDFLQVTTPGTNDIIVFEKKKSSFGETGGIAHFGFRLRNAKDISKMEARILQAGGRIIDKGEFCPGEPYIFFKDPDGYEVEVWYELV